MSTISRAAWAGVTDPAHKRRLLQGRHAYNWARRRLRWARRREVYHLWSIWREKYGPRRGLQREIAAHLQCHTSTVSRDFAALGLRGWEEA